MNRDTRGAVLAALREVHDGRWERNVGTDGGRTLTWKGRIVVVGAVTTAWDRAHDVIASMGDRFVVLRMDSTDGRMRGGPAGRRQHGPRRRRCAPNCAAVVAGVLAQRHRGAAITVTDAERRAHPCGGRRGDAGADWRGLRLPRRRDRRARAGDADPICEATGASGARALSRSAWTGRRRSGSPSAARATRCRRFGSPSSTTSRRIPRHPHAGCPAAAREAARHGRPPAPGAAHAGRARRATRRKP